MPLSFSTAMLVEKNRNQSDHPWCWLWEITITGASGPLRLAMYDSPIVFHGQTFFPTVMQVDALEDATHAALVNLRATIQNVDQVMVALFETYWVTVATPVWMVRQWDIDPTMPDEMPFERANTYSLQSAVTDFMTITAELVLEGYNLTALIPKRRYTATNGFFRIPRR